MVSVTKSWFVDDLDGVSPAVEEITWSFQGADYTAHVSREHADEFKAVMARFTQNATKVGGRRFDPRPLRSEKWTVEDEDERKQIRDWAVGNGMYVSEYGGRTPDEYLRKYCAPNRPDKRNAARFVEAMPEPESLEPEERSISGKMTQDGWYYESFDDAVTVAVEMGRHAIPKDGGGLVVLKEGVPYLQSLSEAAATEKAARGAQAQEKAVSAKTNKNATAAVKRKLFAETSLWRTAADSMCVDTKDVFVQRAKGWLGDETNLRHKTLETADWDEIYEYVLSTRIDESEAVPATPAEPEVAELVVEASAEVGSRTEPAGTDEIQQTAEGAVSEPKGGRRAKAAARTGAREKKPTTRGTKAEPAGGDSVMTSPAAKTTRTRRRPAAA